MKFLFVSHERGDGLYIASELTHSLEVVARTRPEMIDKIKQKVADAFEPGSASKIILREVVDEVMEWDAIDVV